MNMKVNLDDKMNIIELRDLGVPLKLIAYKYGISKGRVSQITLYEKEAVKEKIEAKKEWEKHLTD